jgi:uncharacterized membrane protein
VAAYCSHCGTELSGRFCAKCGAPVPGAPPTDTPGPEIPRTGPPPPGPPPGPPPISLPGLEENVASALCYLVPVVTGVLFLFIEPYNRNKNIRFHAFQSIFLWIGVLLADAAVDIVFGGILGGPNSYELLRLVWTVFRLGVLALWLVLMYRAYMRQRWVLPVVGEMAQKFV